MSIPAQTWYVGSTKWTAVTAWAALTVYAAGALVRQNAAPAVGSERVFVCIIAGTSLASEPTWTITKGAKTAETAGPTWMECTGRAGVNGDLTNTSNWTAVKNTAVALGQVIQRVSGGSLQICTTAGTTSNGSEPSFSNTAGVTTADGGTVVWTSLGAPGNFAAYAAPMARLNLVLATGFFITQGDAVYVSNNHAETQSTAISYNALSPTGIPTPIYCVSDTVAPPTTLATTGTVTTTGASNLSVGSAIYAYGLTFTAGDGSSNAFLTIADSSNQGPGIYESCTFKLGTTSTTSTNIIQGNNGGGGTSSSGLLNMINCTLVLAATGQTFKVGGWMLMRNLVYAATGSVPTTAFSLESAGIITVQDSDLSNLTGNLFTGNATTMFNVFVNNCKLNASAVLTASVPSTLSGPKIRLHNSDSANTNYNYSYSAKGGTVLSETSIVRTSGASDGTTPLSWKFASASTATYAFPFQSEELAQWQNTTGGSKTATIELTTSTSLTNADCWLELEYLGDTASPKGSIVTSRAVPLAAPVTLTTSAASWGGAAQTNKYNIAVSFTPQKKGPIKATVYLAKPSVTVYVDPFLTIS